MFRKFVSKENSMFKKKIKIGIIGYYDPSDKRSYSGTLYNLCESLKKRGAEIIWIPEKLGLFYKSYNKILQFLCSFIHKKYLLEHTRLGACLISKSLDKKLIKQVDLLFAPFSSSALYGLNKSKPLIFFSDSTFSLLINYHPHFYDLHPTIIKQGKYVEQKAFDKSDALILTSDWARNSAIKDFGQAEEKVFMTELGANIEAEDIVYSEKSIGDTLHLLFLGVVWKWKGGDIAVDACKCLNERGIKSVLHVVGIQDLDESIASLPYVDYVGFLNKNDPAQYQQLVDCLRISDCLLLPTLAECAGHAFCEASANGLPVFSHRTGGVGSYVLDGRNGYLLPLGSTGKDFADKIVDCYKSGELLKMSKTARAVYKERLNWEVWADKTEAIINRFI
jgi:glycosyltransferase involved in cell wall biosynthesis